MSVLDEQIEGRARDAELTFRVGAPSCERRANAERRLGSSVAVGGPRDRRVVVDRERRQLRFGFGLRFRRAAGATELAEQPLQPAVVHFRFRDPARLCRVSLEEPSHDGVRDAGKPVHFGRPGYPDGLVQQVRGRKCRLGLRV